MIVAKALDIRIDLHRQGEPILRAHLQGRPQANSGQMVLTMPDGRKKEFDPPNHPRHAHIKINDCRFFSRVVMGSNTGLGEAFMFDEWDTGDIAAALGFDRQFQRKWVYYLGSCEAGFRERALGNLNELTPSLPVCPMR